MATFIGVLSGIIGIYQAAAGLFPGAADGGKTNVRVQVGLDGTPNPSDPADTLDDPKGVVGAIRIYNNNQEFLAESPNNVAIEDGGFADIVINQGTTQQAPYVQVRGSDGDSFCMASVAVTYVDGQKRVWDGSWARLYDPLLWFWSGVTVAEGDINAGYCAWIDAVSGTYFLYMPTFSAGSEDPNPDPNFYLGAQGIRAYQYNDAVTELTLVPREVTNEAQSARRAPPPWSGDNRLVISDRVVHNATELCRSNGSKGPHAVSISEGKFCDMETRETLALCDSVTTSDCFDLKERKVVRRDSKRDARSGFTNVLDWTQDD